MFKYLLIFAITLSPFIAISAQKNYVTVNKEIITDLDINKRLKFLMISTGIENEKEASALYRKQIIDMLIDEELTIQDAKKSDIIVEEDELQSAIENMSQKNSMTVSQMNAYLKSKGSSIDVFKSQLKSQLYLSKVIEQKLRPEIYISEQEIEDNEKAITDSIKSEMNVNIQVNISEIIIYPNESDSKQAIKLANNLASKLKSKANFAKIAREFSQAPSATSDGLIGWVYTEQLSENISTHLVKAQAGDITPPITMPDGSIMILKVNNIKQNKVEDQAIDRNIIRDMLYDKKINIATRAYIQKLRDESYIEIIK